MLDHRTVNCTEIEVSPLWVLLAQIKTYIVISVLCINLMTV